MDKPLQGLSPLELREFTAKPETSDATSMHGIQDVELDLTIELGRTQMPLADVLQLRTGSLVPLDQPVDERVDVYVNGRVVARGEVLVLNDHFCVRVEELVASDDES